MSSAEFTQSAVKFNSTTIMVVKTIYMYLVTRDNFTVLHKVTSVSGKDLQSKVLKLFLEKKNTIYLYFS